METNMTRSLMMYVSCLFVQPVNALLYLQVRGVDDVKIQGSVRQSERVMIELTRYVDGAWGSTELHAGGTQ